MKPVFIGVYSNHKFGCSRYKDLIPVLNSIPNVVAEEYTPFTPYNVLLLQESSIDGNGTSLFSTNKDARWVLDSDMTLAGCNVVLSTHCDLLTSKVFSETQSMNKRLRRDAHMIVDGVVYRPARPYKKELQSVVWYGRSKDLNELSTVNPVLASIRDRCKLKIISDSHEVYLKASAGLEIETDFKEYNYATFNAELESADLVILPSTRSPDALLRYLEAAVRGLPVLWGDCEEYQTLYTHLMQNFKEPGAVELLQAFKPAKKAHEYLDQFDLWCLGLSPAKEFLKRSRTFAVEGQLIQNRVEAWLEFFFGVLRA